MRRILPFVFFCLAMTCSLAAQQNEPPDPADLDVSWWRYFEEQEDFSTRLQQVRGKLMKLQEGVDPESAPLISSEIERLLLAMQSLEAVHSQDEAEYEAVNPLYLETYHLSDWLNVSQKIRQLNQEKEQVLSENQRIQVQMDSLRQNLDLFQIHYRILEGAPAEKILLGLQIMRNRMEIEILEKRLKSNNRLLTLIEEDKEKLIEERSYAEEHMSFANLKPAVQEEKLQEARFLYEKASSKLLELEKKKSQAESGTSAYQLAEIKALSAAIEAAHARAQVLFQRVLLQLAQKDRDPKEVQEEFLDWERTLNILENNTESWSEVLEAVNVDDADMTPETLQGRREALSSLGELRSSLADTKLVVGKLEDSIVEESSTLWQITLAVVRTIENIAAYVLELFSFTLFRVNDYPVTPLILARAFLIVILAVIGGRLLLKAIKSNQPAVRQIGRSNLYAIGKMIYYAVVICGFMFAFFSLGFDMTNFVIIGGALGVGIGLGLQSIVNNFFSGVVLLFEKRLRVRDIIEVDENYKGRVQAINILNTHIRTFDGIDVIVPNSEFLTKRLVNWTMKDHFLRLHIPFGVGYDSDVEEVKKLVLEAAAQIPNTIQDERICPAPRVWMKNLGDNALSYELAVWVDLRDKSSEADLISEYTGAVERTLREHGVEMPFPQRDIWIREIPDKLASSSTQQA